ncbi:MAG: hypothetical protein JXA71_04405, partial [Chitinispirillaceae bacterium]|nr:hypothetical protein [Chitinispirillaceae bacterium]
GFLVRLQEEGGGWGEMLGRNLFSSDGDAGIAVSHVLFATVAINSLSDFLFPGSTGLTVAYDPLRKRAQTYLGVSF